MNTLCHKILYYCDRKATDDVFYACFLAILITACVFIFYVNFFAVILSKV